MPQISGKNLQYTEERKMQNVLLLRSRLKELPPFMAEFFRGIGDYTEPLTRIGYAYDFRLFFGYLSENEPKFNGRPIRDFTFGDLAMIDAVDIENFMEYLSYYVKESEGRQLLIQNEAQGKSRKLAAVRTMLAYFYKKGRIPSNPGELVDFPKLRQKNIIRLEFDEVARLLDEVEGGGKLTTRQQKFDELTRKRDLALVTLLLGTGMRVSECVGIDLDHIDFDICGVKVVRKGGDEAVIYFGPEVEAALADYLEARLDMTPMEGHERALFLSLQNRRITVRAVQNLVKKYASLVTSLKKISPHKLRSTFGTHLYQETGDIYLVADMLGHSDVNTTRKHYANMEEERRRTAARAIRLRED